MTSKKHELNFDKTVPDLFEEIQSNLNYLNHIKIQKNIKNLIKQADNKYGKSISFKLRGIGIDNCSCFVCNGDKRMLSSISAFVKSKSDGEEIVEWFGQGAYLDYDSYDNLNFYVKVGACAEHLPNLKKLDKLTYSQYNVLRKHIIEEAKELSNESKK